MCFDPPLRIPIAVLNGLSSTLSGFQVILGVGEEEESDFASTLSYDPVSNMVCAVVWGLCFFAPYYLTARGSTNK